MLKEGVKFIKAEHFEEPTKISNIINQQVISNIVDCFSYLGVYNSESVDYNRGILWSKFVICDHNDRKLETEHQYDSVFIVGFDGGVQVYGTGIDGKLSLIFSQAIGKIVSATVLPSPLEATSDLFTKERPLMAVAFESQLAFYSMRSGRSVEIVSKPDIVELCATKKLIVASSRSELVLLSPCKLVVLMTLTNCRSSAYMYVPVAHALSDHWLAFSDNTLNPSLASVGGDISNLSDKPYALSIMDLKKKMTTAVVVEDGDNDVHEQTGIVSIVCLDKLLDSLAKGQSVMAEMHLQSRFMVAHFTAHEWTAVLRMIFDCTGTLLLTTCKHGLFCHLFRIVPHPTNCSEAAVLHLYRLHCGDTTRSIVSLSISRDSRLAAASSDHGTVHIWPISNYGGPLCVRTHCQGHIVNRLSRLERSAGMQEYQVTRPNNSTLSNAASLEGPPNHFLHAISPRLPPLPFPCTLDSYVQLKPLSAIPPSNRPLALIPFFSTTDTAGSLSMYNRTECILVLSPDSRLLQYALNIRADPQFQPIPNKTEVDAPFLIEKKCLLQWHIPSVVINSVDRTHFKTCSASQSKNPSSRTSHGESRTAMLQSLIPDFSESLEQLQEGNIVTPQSWFSNIEISSQISPTSSVRRQDKFSISSYQSQELSDVRLEVLPKSPSISSLLSNISWRGDDRPKEEVSSQPVRVPNSEHRIQICNSFCGSSISDSFPDSSENVIFALANAIRDDEGTDLQASDNWEDSKINYIESMTRDMSHVRLRRVSGSFSSDIGRLSLLSTSPTHADIPEERHSQEERDCKAMKLKKRQDKKKSRKT